MDGDLFVTLSRKNYRTDYYEIWCMMIDADGWRSKIIHRLFLYRHSHGIGNYVDEDETARHS